MALNKHIETDQIAIVGPYRQLSLRVSTVIERDGVEISRTTRTEVLNPDTDLTKHNNFARAVANAAWTPEIKEKWKNRPSLNIQSENRASSPAAPPTGRPT